MLRCTAVALAILCSLMEPAPAHAQQAEETPESLPPGEGREETFYACTPCHGFALVQAQGMTRPQWDATVDWMIERQGMAELDPVDRQLIVDYLATHFPPRQQRGRPNPFLNR